MIYARIKVEIEWQTGLDSWQKCLLLLHLTEAPLKLNTLRFDLDRCAAQTVDFKAILMRNAVSMNHSFCSLSEIFGFTFCHSVLAQGVQAVLFSGQPHRDLPPGRSCQVQMTPGSERVDIDLVVPCLGSRISSVCNVF